MTAEERERKVFNHDKMTVLNDEGHYELKPQRGCFERCERCYNLSEADSFEKNGLWHYKAECQFCVQRAIDMLGYFEHGIAANSTMCDTPKSRQRQETHDLYAALEKAADVLNVSEE